VLRACLLLVLVELKVEYLLNWRASLRAFLSTSWDGWIDGKSFTKNDHDVLYYM
jgi:hypothetical protein